MNCAEVRERLADAAYDALPAEEQSLVGAHVRGCPECRRQAEELRQVRVLLDAAPAPLVRVDMDDIYRTAAAAAESRRLRRWRRLALAACAAAAALLLFVSGRLEVRVDAHQLVVRWKAAPAPEAPAPTSPAVAAAAPPAPGPSPAEWRVANALLQALVDDAKLRDVQHQQDVTRLRAQIEELQRQTTRRWALAEQKITALYNALLTTAKGANQ
jgi:hypothetical protein